MNQAASVFVLGSFVVACSVKVEHLPRPGESLRAESFTLEAGGKGFNLALGAHRLGATVDGLFAVGTDLMAGLAEPAFVGAGLDPAMLRRVEAATGGGVGFTDARGENCLAVHPGANLLLSAQHVRSRAAAIREARLTLAQFEIADEPIGEAFALARQAGRLTLLNPSPYRQVSAPLLQATSILVLNAVEASHMAGVDVSAGLQAGDGRLESWARGVLAQGPDLVVVTHGARGATAFPRGGPPIAQAAFPVAAVDSLGAGDAFTAGLAASLLEGRPLRDCLERAAACGAILCRGVGVFEHMPDRAALSAFLHPSEGVPPLPKQ